MNNELTHWGIKGQKWGVRRYQNEDGTLTAAGKARYFEDLGNTYKREYDNQAAKLQSQRKRGQLSAEEYKARKKINEDAYRKNVSETKYADLSRGSRRARRIAGAVTLGASTVKVLAGIGTMKMKAEGRLGKGTMTLSDRGKARTLRLVSQLSTAAGLIGSAAYLSTSMSIAAHDRIKGEMDAKTASKRGRVNQFTRHKKGKPGAGYNRV